MAWARHTIPAFLAGELSPLMDGRFDTEQYALGLDSCENFIPANEGPLVKRPGFALIRAAAPSSTWLTAFRRGVTQEYVLEWFDLGLRFFTNGARIETAPNVAYEVATPYTAAEAPMIAAQQNFDRQYLWHAAHPPAALRRDDATTFTHEVLQLVDGPFADDNTNKALTLTASGGTGAITLTASAALFTAGHVGSPIKLEARDFATIPAWEPGMSGITAGEKVHNEGKVYQAATSGKTGSVQPLHTDGTYYDGQLKNDEINAKGPYGVAWTYLYDRIGIATITGFVSATVVNALVTRRIADSVVSAPTWRWALAAFSAAAGWPHIGTIWKGRYVAFKDFDIVASVVGDYGGGRVNFATYSETGQLADDLAFRRTLSIDEPPHWVARDRQLILGTPTREVAIGPISNSPVSGSNISAEDQSFYGSEPVFPVQVATETVFVQRAGRRLRGADFDFQRDRYDADDLTAAAGHIAGKRPGANFIQLTFQRGPQTLIYAVRSDGQLVAHPKTKLETKGFARVKLGGGAMVKSAVAIVGEDGRTEELWVLVERLAGDGATTLKEIWKQERWWELGDDQEQAFYVDGGVRIAAAAGQTTFHGLAHLAGQEVAVLCAGGVVPGCSVDASGTLALPATSVPQTRPFTVVVGLAYTAEAVTLRPQLTVDGTSSQAMRQRVVKVMTRIIETLGIKVGVPGGATEEVVRRAASQQMDKPVPLATGDYGSEVEAEFDLAGRARWISDVPLPAIVAAAMLNYDVSSRDV